MGEESSAVYTRTAVLLHWAVGLLVLTLIAVGLYMVDIPRGTPERSLVYNFHKSLGLTASLFIIFRLIWRIYNPPPPLPNSVAKWQIVLSKFSHWLMYGCLIVMPISGFSASQFTKWGVNFYGIVKIPPMAFKDKEIYDILQGIHSLTAWILVTLVIVHILAAIKHAAIDRDGVLKRMGVLKR